MKNLFVITFLFFVNAGFSQDYKQEITMDFTEYINSMVNKDFKKATSWVYEGLFDVMPKKQFVNIYKQSFANPDIEVRIKDPKIIDINEVENIDGKDYCLFSYSNILHMKFLQFKKEENQEYDKRLEATHAGLNQSFGPHHVKFNEETKFFEIYSEKQVYAITDHGKTEWKFLTMDKKAILILVALLPEQLMEKYVKENMALGADEPEIEQPEENLYEGLRNLAFTTNLERAKAMPKLGPEEQTMVYAIIMDWDLGDSIATLTANKDGDASMYISTGGGIIGGGEYALVRQAVASYLNIGQAYLGKAAAADATPLPDPGCIRFYLLTNQGAFFIQETTQNIENEELDGYLLFKEANKVLTELQIASK